MTFRNFGLLAETNFNRAGVNLSCYHTTTEANPNYMVSKVIYCQIDGSSD